MEIAMEATKHRRAKIIDALKDLFECLLEKPEDSGFPIQVKTIQKRFIYWTTLDQQGAIPALLLHYGDGRRKYKGGTPQAKHASLNEMEELFPVALTAVLKESVGPKGVASEMEAPEMEYPITDQAADLIYSLERLVNGTRDLDVEGVRDTAIIGDDNTEGVMALLEGTPFEMIKFRIIVTHVYPSNTSV